MTHTLTPDLSSWVSDTAPADDDSSFKFELLYQSKRSRARIGKIRTPHGIIDTPNFVGVGTNGTLKALDNAIVEEIGLQLMFCKFEFGFFAAKATRKIPKRSFQESALYRKNPMRR